MRMIVASAAAVVLALPVSTGCQEIDPVAVSPAMYKVLLENDHVRIVEYSIKPGESDQPHTHPPKVSYVVEGGTLRITLPDTAFESEESPGEVTFRSAVPRHFATNVGKTSVRIVLFEIKKIDSDAVPLAEDPPRNNPLTLSVKLENESVRVMGAVIPPGYKEKQHTHPPYATYVLTGGTLRMHLADGTTKAVEYKAGEARFTDRVTHWAENTGTSTVRVVLVEIRHGSKD